MTILNSIRTKLKNVWTSIPSDSFMSFFNASGVFNKTQTQLLEEYKSIVYGCVSAIASDVAKYEPILIHGKKRLETHSFLSVIHNPNPHMSQYEFFEATQTYLEMAGEVFWYLARGKVSREVREMYIMRPDHVKIVVLNNEIQGYKLDKANGQSLFLEPEEVAHIKMFNPTNSLRGMSPLQAALLYIETEKSIAEYQYNFMQNQASPSGVLSLSGNVTKETFQKIKDQWRENQSGIENVGKTLIIRGSDASFTKIGLSLSEMDLAGIKELSKQDVREAFKVPEAILGKTDSSGLGRANIESIEYIYAKRTIEPKLVRLDDAIQKILNQGYEEGLMVDHVSQVPDDRIQIVNEYVQGVDKWLTRNEIRYKEGLPKVTGGDELYTEFSKLPLGSDPNVDEAKALVGVKKKVQKIEWTDNENINRFFDLLERIEKRTEKVYKENFNKLLEEQAKKVSEIFENYGNTKQFIGFNGTEFTLTFTKEEIELNLLGALFQSLIDAGQEGVNVFGQPDSDFVLQQSTRDAIFNSTQRLTRSFNEQTALLLQKQFAAGAQLNETPEQLAKRVESVYSEAKGYRALRIANTESHKAINYGVAESYRQAGITRVKWVANPGACEFCRALDGSISPIGKPFIPKGGSVQGDEGGEYIADYDDITYADAHPNCRCKLEPIII